MVSHFLVRVLAADPPRPDRRGTYSFPVSMAGLPLAHPRHTLSDYGQVFAETTFLAIIPAVVLLVLQRYFVASVALSGSKE